MHSFFVAIEYVDTKTEGLMLLWRRPRYQIEPIEDSWDGANDCTGHPHGTRIRESSSYDSRLRANHDSDESPVALPPALAIVLDCT